MNSEELLRALERSGLVADDVLAGLRARLTGGGHALDPSRIVQSLVAEGHLTQAQGSRLLSTAVPPPDASMPVIPDDDLEVLPDDEEDDLLPPPPASAAPAAPPSGRRAKPSSHLPETRVADDDLGLLPLEDEPVLAPLKAPSAKPAPSGSASGLKAALGPTKKPEKKRRSWRSEIQRQDSLAAGLDSLLGSEAAAEAGTAGAAPAKRMRALGGGTIPGARNAWDSPLLLIGGGTVLGLVILGAALFWMLTRQTAGQALQQAEDDYRGGSYSQAILKYDNYLEKFPKHASVSVARVHRGLAQLRQAVEGTSDWSKALASADRVLGEISPEKDFAEAHNELAAVLPQIAKGLAGQTTAHPSPELATQTRQAVALVEKYVPANLTPADQLREIEGSLALANRRLDRDKALAAAIAAMNKAASAGSPEQAYATRKQLLQAYPELADDSALVEAVATIAQAELAAVKYVAEKRAAAVEERPSRILVSVALTATAGAAAPIEDSEAIVTLAAGAAYSLDGRTGKPRWRRFLGLENELAPQVIASTAGSEALCVDAARQELVLVDAATGKLRWRQPVGESVAEQPLVIRDRIVAATRSGKLLVVDLKSGELRGTIQLPQPLRVAPGADAAAKHYYQVAEHSNLYVLSSETGACQEVFYLGHEPESIAVRPLVVGRYLFVAVNAGAEDSLLRVLLTDEQGLNLQVVEQVPLKGHVFSPLESGGRSLVVATDHGALYSFEIGAPGAGRTLTKVAEKPADERTPLVRFAVLRGAELWLAGYGLTRYDMQASRGLLAPKWVDNDRAVAVHSPQVRGSVIVDAMRRGDASGVTFAAANGTDGKRFWESRVAVPLATAPLVEPASDKAVAWTTAGFVYEVPAVGLASRKLSDAPVAVPLERTNLPAGAPLAKLSDGRCVLPLARPDSKDGLREVLVYDQRSAADKLRRRPLPDAASGWPVAFANGLMVAGKIGQVFVIDPDTGRNLVEPFQPTIEGGREVAWGQPTALDERQALVSDGATKLYRLAVVDDPRPHLAAAATAELANPLTTPIVVAGEHAWAVDAANELAAFHLPDMAPAKSIPLGSRVAWGPEVVGGRVLAATMSGQVFCVESAERVVWQVALPEGNLTGTPYASEGAIVAATSAGTIYRLASDSGRVLAQFDLGQPIAFGPARWHDRLLLAGRDGTLHVTSEPK
ncbi:MAG: PQQ-binding-like beta-propeller repeat protein [Planctomycetia bacterium]|nr:PQQ-binding-like beta-propeller repeat protein [Planctomycetia bacterium]